jgi:hypothetical protein
MPLTTPAHYQAALAEIEPFFIAPPAPNTPQEAHYLALFKAIENYEAIHCPLD